MINQAHDWNEMASQPSGAQRHRVNLNTGEYSTTDIYAAALLLMEGMEVVGVEPAGYSTRRVRWTFDDPTGEAARLAALVYSRPEEVTVNLAELRTATKTLMAIGNQALR